MTLCVAVKKSDAEKVRRQLLAQNALDLSRYPTRDSKYVYFPVTKKVKGLRIVQRKLKSRKLKPHSLKEALRGKFTQKQLDLLTRSFDIIGNIAVIEIQPALARKARPIGKALLLVHPNVKAVYMKAGKMQGTYRVRQANSD